MLEVFLRGPFRENAHGKNRPIRQLDLEHLATFLGL
jgi:hypothetical protein